MKRTIFSLAAIICGFSVLASGQNTQTQKLVEQSSVEAPFQNALVGAFAVRAQNDTLVSFNHNLRMIPASNAKLITTGIALHYLGSDWKYRTGIAYSGTVREGTLEGDLYIVGSGDPTLAADYKGVRKIEQTFAEWKSFLDDAGITRINGFIIGDGRHFDGNSIPGSWEYDDLGTYYGATPEGLNFRENTQTFKVGGIREPGRELEFNCEYPSTPWLKVVCTATFGEGRVDNTWYYNSSIVPVALVKGEFGVGRRSSTITKSNRFAAYTCAHEFFSFLGKHGLIAKGYADIGPTGNIRRDLMDPTGGEKACDGLTFLGYSESQPLREIIADCNRESDNFYAEALVRTVSREITGSADYECCDDARNTVLRMLRINGAENCKFADGCGLSNLNGLTPEFIVNFLTGMKESDAFPDYLASLPYPGIGTLSALFRNEDENFRKRIRMKSGTVSGVLSFSGYILPEDGNPDGAIVFSVITNNMISSKSSVLNKIQEIIKSIADDGK